MPTDHVVSQGECVVSIALAHGFPPQKLWNLAENGHLRKGDGAAPEILEPGRIVHIPEPEAREVSRASEQRHVFRALAVPVHVRVRFLDNGEPRANAEYEFEIDGEVRHGKLDAGGGLEEPVPPDARAATVRLGPADEPDVHELRIGWLDPLTTVSGCQARLNNLGFHSGPVDDIQGPITTDAVKTFQRHRSIKVDGIIGPQTRGELLDAHGC